MFDATHIQDMSGYFRNSDQFYYVLIDPKGNFIYVNPLFQKKFSHIAADFYGAHVAGIFIIDDKEKYNQVVQHCIENPLVIVSAKLKIKFQEDSLVVTRWEFTAYINKGKLECIQGIGIAIEEIKKDMIGKQRAKKHLQQSDEQEMQIHKQLIQASIDRHEKERQEIGKELHDNINQHLATNRLYLEMARDKVTGESFEIINVVHQGLSNIIKELRQLSQSLVPTALGDIGLIESIQEICNSLKRTHAFSINFFHRHFNEEQLPDDLKLMFFRIIQEQINNILRHADADMIQIRLQSDAEYTMLSIADNGKGFDSSNYKKGLGLINIINRVGLFNGEVEINASPGKGCTIAVSIPSAAKEMQEMN
ncbi:MAG TPA: ATP-binding protein [Chitinophagaceae bacterium]|nr:ATP-binding protein [Chitinophagaceae bacterium]